MDEGRKIKELRKSKGWDQKTLAEKSGMTTTYIGKIERGEAPHVSLSYIQRIALALEVPVSVLTDEISLEDYKLLKLIKETKV